MCGMGPKIRVGIVGATVTVGGSGWGAHAHVPALNALPDYELKAVCTAHADTAQASAAAFGAELAFHNFEAMVSHPDIDLVVVSVRVPGHYDLVMQALEAGKAVFCEWPLGASVAEAGRQAGIYSGWILKGTPPIQMPVQQNTQTEFVINLDTAQALGFTVPVALLARADSVIQTR